jgi:hypothetical protein
LAIPGRILAVVCVGGIKPHQSVKLAESLPYQKSKPNQTKKYENQKSN